MFVFERRLWYNDLQRNPRSGGGVESFPLICMRQGVSPSPPFGKRMTHRRKFYEGKGHCGDPEVPGAQRGQHGGRGQNRLRQRHDERCAGFCKRPVRAAYRPDEPPGGAHGRNDGHALHRVRPGKEIDPNVVALARQKEITVLASPYRMFTACGLLYSNGLRGGCEIR